MSSPIIFALTRAQARVIDNITRPGWKPYHNTLVLDTLERRYLVQQRRRRYVLTALGHEVQVLVRMLGLHNDATKQP